MANIPDTWLGQPGPVQETGLSVTMSHGLRDAIREAAEAEGVSASYWMRRAAVAALRNQDRIEAAS